VKKLRYYRAWCPACRVFLQLESRHAKNPADLLCPGCCKDRPVAGSAHYPLKGSVIAKGWREKPCRQTETQPPKH